MHGVGHRPRLNSVATSAHIVPAMSSTATTTTLAPEATTTARSAPSHATTSRAHFKLDSKPVTHADDREIRRREHHEADIVIVGGGIVGCAAAVAFGRQGRSVILLEKSMKEPDRIVGELLQPGGVEALEKLGLRGMSTLCLKAKEIRRECENWRLNATYRLPGRHRRSPLLRIPGHLPPRASPYPLSLEPAPQFYARFSSGRPLFPPRTLHYETSRCCTRSTKRHSS